MSRSVAYTSSPLLASRTPVWRSKFIVGAIALGFLGLAGRAAWVQVFGNAFFQKQGEVRFARTVELPANFSGDVNAEVLRAGRVENAHAGLAPRERTRPDTRTLHARAGQGGAPLSFTVGDGTLRIRQEGTKQ